MVGKRMPHGDDCAAAIAAAARDASAERAITQAPASASKHGERRHQKHEMADAVVHRRTGQAGDDDGHGRRQHDDQNGGAFGNGDLALRVA